MKRGTKKNKDKEGDMKIEKLYNIRYTSWTWQRNKERIESFQRQKEEKLKEKERKFLKTLGNKKEKE